MLWRHADQAAAAMSDAIEQEGATGAEETDEVLRAVEATLFASEEPLSVDTLAGHLGGLEKSAVRLSLIHI